MYTEAFAFHLVIVTPLSQKATAGEISAQEMHTCTLIQFIRKQLTQTQSLLNHGFKCFSGGDSFLEVNSNTHMSVTGRNQ